jgi:two-component system, sensor histidine kinase
LAAGINDYVTKPFEEHLLLLSILKQVTVATESTNIESHSGDLSKAKLYDLTKLIEASRGNDVFVHKMVKLFITQAELSINQLNQSFQTGDFKVVKEVAHRFKPSIDNMGIHSLKQEIRSIESMAAENPSAELLAQPIEHLSTVVNDVCVQLKHDFNTIF